MTGKNLFAEGEFKPLAPLNWPLFADNTSRLLASDKEASYSLKKLADGLQNDSFVLHSSSEALVYDLLYERGNSLFGSFYKFDVLIVCVCVLAVMLVLTLGVLV